MPVLHRTLDRQELVNRPQGADLARGGHSLYNLEICCIRCYETKGNMTKDEFKSFKANIAHFPTPVIKNILARLRAGGRIMLN